MPVSKNIRNNGHDGMVYATYMAQKNESCAEDRKLRLGKKPGFFSE